MAPATVASNSMRISADRVIACTVNSEALTGVEQHATNSIKIGHTHTLISMDSRTKIAVPIRSLKSTIAP